MISQCQLRQTRGSCTSLRGQAPSCQMSTWILVHFISCKLGEFHLLPHRMIDRGWLPALQQRSCSVSKWELNWRIIGCASAYPASGRQPEILRIWRSIYGRIASKTARFDGVLPKTRVEYFLAMPRRSSYFVSHVKPKFSGQCGSGSTASNILSPDETGRRMLPRHFHFARKSRFRGF